MDVQEERDVCIHCTNWLTKSLTLLSEQAKRIGGRN